ncbi:sensor histidine kinase [Rhodoglobus aureus]|uniref:histidine kinase n=1 Tax=Rhodoglobus aureus TaxID=191497 RepID=A0ABN1VJG7_9MICO
MGYFRWMSIAVVVTVAVMTVLVVGSGAPPANQWGAGVALGVLVVAWFTLGIRAGRSTVAAVLFVGILAVTLGVGVALMPTMATLQAIAYPLVWTIIDRTRNAIIGNIVVAVAVGVGFVIFLGTSPEAIAETIAIVGLSLIFSLALGLWITQISHLSEQRQTLLTELHATRDELAAVSRDAGVASERERLAREIHDTIAQDLTGLVLVAQRARRELDTNNAAAAAEQLELIEESARAALAETRAMVAASAPVGLTSDGISAALERLAERYSRETHVSVTVNAAGLPTIARETEVVVLRCAQEALANIRKHAEASHATIEVTAVEGAVSILVTDDGEGFDTEKARTGFGLEGMSERLALVSGQLTIDSSRAGTILHATIPLGATA